jgi:hypothetical protein
MFKGRGDALSLNCNLFALLVHFSSSIHDSSRSEQPQMFINFFNVYNLQSVTSKCPTQSSIWCSLQFIKLTAAYFKITVK